MDKTVLEDQLTIMPSPPNPIQREAMYHVSKGKVNYIFSDPRQGILLCWNTLWKQCKKSANTNVLITDPGILAIFKELIEETGLSPLTFINGETPSSVRSKLSTRKKQTDFDPLQKLPWQNWKRRVIARYDHESKNLFGDRSYHIIAREWYEARAKGYADILEARTDPSHFQFTPQEFYQLRGRVKEAESIFNPQISRNEVLSRLHHRFFSEMSAEEAEEWLYDQLDEAARYTRELLNRTHKILSGYKKHIQADRFETFRNFQEEIEKVRDRIDAALLNFGNDFYENTSSLQGRLKQSFSPRSKELEQHRKQVKLAYMELHRSLENSVFGPYIEAFEDLSMRSVMELLTLQEKRLEASWPEVLQMAQEGQIRLNSRNMEGSEDQIMVIQHLEGDIEDWFKKLNAWRIFDKPMEENALSLTKKGEILGHILELLEDTSSQLPRFIPYHQWRSFTLHLPDPIRHIIDLLGEERNPDWVSSLECWYLSQLLALYQQPSMPMDQYDRVPSMWQDKRQAEMLTWIDEYSNIDPDGGWITKLNQLPENSPVHLEDKEELDRLFPIQVFQDFEDFRSNESGLNILLEMDGSDSFDRSIFSLIISNNDTVSHTKDYHRLFDPRPAWHTSHDILNIKHADKIKGIRRFAEALVYDISPARLFQSKDLLIVSKWPELVERKLEQRLGKNLKIQDISQEEDAVALMEGLLNNERPLILLVEEGFLNMHDPVWESMVLGWCESAGMKIISLNWRDAWRNENTWLDQITENLNHH